LPVGLWASGVGGDALGEVLQQVGWPADAVLGAEAGMLPVATAAWNPAPVASMTTMAVSPTSSVTVTR
jgi:hypothetical protein